MQISNPFPAWIPNPLEVDFVSGTLLNRLYAKYSLQRLLFLQTNNRCAGWEIMSAFHMGVEYMGCSCLACWNHCPFLSLSYSQPCRQPQLLSLCSNRATVVLEHWLVCLIPEHSAAVFAQL